MKYLKHKVVANDGNSHSIYFMREDSKSFCRLYYFYDDNKHGYLDTMSVHPSIRKQGEGTRLQKMREALLKQQGYTHSRLWVSKDSWMERWYQRRGYEYHSKHRKEKNCIWLQKKLK